MRIDYKKELENSAKNMILIHDPDLLTNTILGMIVKKVKVSHASILLDNAHSYVLTVSQGELGAKMPVGLARIDKENPLVVFFKEKCDSVLFGRRSLVYAKAKGGRVAQRALSRTRQLLKGALYQMETFYASVCIPIDFRGSLLGILLLGEKVSRKAFDEKELDFLNALASNIAMGIVNARLFKELELSLERKHQFFIRTTIALAAAIEAKDNYTHGHTTRVTNMSLGIAKELKQKHRSLLGEHFLEDLHFASLLHDIGKIGVPEYILNKEGELTDAERETVKKHPLIGVAILKSIKELKGSLSGIRHHHERYDGLGYPDGLKGDQIPMTASIISVADSFDAMTTDRPYRRRLSRPDALAEIRSLRGKQFDPRVSDVFVDLCSRGEV